MGGVSKEEEIRQATIPPPSFETALAGLPQDGGGIVAINQSTKSRQSISRTVPEPPAMMQNLRAASQTWTGRIVSSLLMGFIVLSFAIFGIGDFFRGFGSTKLASAGDTEISAESFRSAWQTQLQRLSAQVKKNVTNEEARAAGLDRQLVNSLVNEALVNQRARKLGLAVSDAAINDLVTTDPTFKNALGEFDRIRFAEALRQGGLSERGFLEEQRKVTLRQQQVEAVSGALNPPVTLLEMLNRSRNERRSIDYFVLPASSVGEIALPAEDELKKYFATRAQNFRAPEYRKLVVLAVSPDGLAKPDAVTAEAAQKRYEENKTLRYTNVEKRALQQIPFDKEADAVEALALIKAGTSFEEISKQRNLAPADIDLGTLDKKAMPVEIANVAFALEEGVVSEPVKNLFGFSLLRATKISPALVRPFAEVEGEIRQELSILAARKDAKTLYDKIEEARTSGKTLTESAKQAGLEVRLIEAVDAAGRDKNGGPVTGLPDLAALLKAAFASDVGVDNETITTRDRGNLWFEVAAIEPARAQTFEEVKPLVEQAWRGEETAKQLSAKSAELLKKLNDGGDLAAIAEAEGKLEVKHVGDVRRNGSPDLPATVVVQVFNAAIGGAGSALAPGGRILFKVLDKAVQPLDAKSDEAKKLETELRAALSDELFQQYVAQLRGEAGVKINDAMLRQLTGGETN